MNTTYPLVLWLWGCGQATCLALIVWVAARLTARFQPAVRVTGLLTTLVVMGLLPWWVYSSPWLAAQFPSTKIRLTAASIWAAATGRSDRPDIGGAHGARHDHDRTLHDSAASADLATSPDTADRAEPWVDAASHWLAKLIERPRVVSLTPGQVPLRSFGRALIAVLGLSIAWGLLRWGLGTWQLRRLTRAGRLVHDDPLWDLAEPLAEQLEVRRPVSYRAVSQLATPAVLGWRRPTILLPEDWASWSPPQLRAALAHELAHIRRRDPLTTLVAQLALALNYFHPLAHLLVAQLRLDQELAADSLAAPLVGGRQAYWESLAGLALRRSPRPMHGPALAFLPSRRSFVRRLEMLRTLPLRSSGWSRPLQTMAAMSVVLLGLIIATVQPTSAQNLAAPQTASESDRRPETDSTNRATGAADAAIPDLIQYVPEGFSAGIVEIDVATLAASPALAPVVEGMPPEARKLNVGGLELAMDQLERVVIALGPRLNPDREAIVLIRMKSPANAQTLSNLQDNVHRYGGADRGPHQLDERTVVLGEAAPEMLRLAAALGQKSRLTERLQRHAESPLRFAVRVDAVRAAQPLPPHPVTAALHPLLQDVTTASAGLSLGKELNFQLLLDTTKPQEVAETLSAVRTLAKNALQSLQQPQGKDLGQHDAIAFGMVRSLALPALETASIEPKENQVAVNLTVDNAAPLTIGLLLPAVQAARQAAQRTHASNSLKQIALAMHNYHDAYGHLPPSVIVENGVARSWRVEILPFLEQDALYRLYRKDLPWDSPENQRVLQQMPAIYAAPGRPAGTKTGFRAIAGPHGALGRPGGTRFADVVDGTSNSMLAVECDVLVAWTEPDEFAPTPETLIGHGLRPEGFLAAMMDGSVRMISNSVEPAMLQALLTIDGGEQVNY
jgi:hypothetical protein